MIRRLLAERRARRVAREAEEDRQVEAFLAAMRAARRVRASR